ncbi:MAG TPA: pyrroline-5-carboxylate reductase [Opitutaceae bacterium]|nr:pyrroline-5-carboxylate reductase [Opitutaceae bacterium]
MAKIAFLGAGNMAAAMVEGLLADKSCQPGDVVCFSGSGKTSAALAARTGIRVAPTLPDLVASADTLVVAFKPQHLAGADPQLADFSRGKLVISVLAGKRLPTLARTFPSARNIVRTMPNTPGQIGAGVTAWCARAPLAPADRATLDQLLGALGTAIEVRESDMDAVTAISGSGPAYVFEFAAALRDAGEAAGLSREAAEKLTVETLLGAARLLARKAIDPELLRDQVTSPNGTTFAGLQRMSARDFRGMIRETVLAAKARSEELSQD